LQVSAVLNYSGIDFLLSIHMVRNSEIIKKIEERNDLARKAEQEGVLDEAIRLYEQNILENYIDEFSFDRLMSIYRKQNELKEELRVIMRGIGVFEAQLEEHLKQSFTKVDEHIVNSMEDVKGYLLTYFPDPVKKWMTRKEIVEQKLQETF